ncbi:putative ribonuclease H-like domain-containing protein [Tanacetum coccineum]
MVPKNSLNLGPIKNVINNAYSTARRPFNKIKAANNINFNKRVNIVNDKNVNVARLNVVVNTARPKAVLSVVKGNKGNAETDPILQIMKKLMDDLLPLEVIPKEGKLLGKGIKREFSVARTPQQNRVAERKNKTLIKAARAMLADLKLPTTFWAEAVNTACYVQHRVLVIKPHNKTPHELFLGRKLVLSFMRPFRCPVTILNTIDHLGTKACDDAGKTRMETVPGKDYILLPLWTQDPPFSSSSKDSPDAGFKPSREEEKKDAEDPGNEDSEVTSTIEPRVNQEKDPHVNTVSPTVNAAGIVDNVVAENIVYGCADDLNMPELEEIGRFSDAEDDISGADMNNLDTYFQVSLVPTTIIHKDYLIEQIIRDLNSAPQTRRMTRNLEEHGFLSTILEQRRNHKDINNWIEELLKFKLQEVWTLVELPNGKRAIGTKWDFRNKKDERGIVIKNKARLVAQDIHKRKRIDYDEVFAPVARIEAIRLFLAYASFKDFVGYQMDVKSAFIYGKIEEEVFVCQPPGFEDLDFPDRRGKIDKTLFIKRDKSDILLVQVYVDDIIFGSTRKKMCTEFEKMMHKKFQMSSMGELGIFLGLASASRKRKGISLVNDQNTYGNSKGFADGEDVDEHLYRSMIGSLMCLTSSRPDIMFAVYACARFQVNPKVSHLHAVKRIFRYLKGQPKLGIRFPMVFTFILGAYTDSDYAGASLNRKSTTRRLSVPRVQSKIHIDNESTICIVKNPVFHSNTKHIEIRYHFIRDSNEKKIIQMIKIHTDRNFEDLLTKAFD